MIAAIKYADAEGCEIHSDSEFWINVLTKWAPGWQANGGADGMRLPEYSRPDMVDSCAAASAEVLAPQLRPRLAQCRPQTVFCPSTRHKACRRLPADGQGQKDSAAGRCQEVIVQKCKNRSSERNVKLALTFPSRVDFRPKVKAASKRAQMKVCFQMMLSS